MQLNYKSLGITSLALGIGAIFYFNTVEEVVVVDNENEETNSHLIVMNDEERLQAKIDIEKMQELVIEESFTAPGKVTLNRSAQSYVVPRVEGYVKEVLVHPGQTVEKGQILAWIDSIVVANAKADFLKALQLKNLNETIYQAEKNLSEKKISSQHDYLSAKNHYEEAKLAENIAKQQLLALGLSEDELLNEEAQASLYPLRAPISGSVIFSSLIQGELVDSSRQAFLIADLNTLYAELSISPKDVSKIAVGQKCLVKALKSEFEGEGTIISITPTVDAKTYLSKAICLLPNLDQEWVVGSFVNGRVVTSASQVPIAVLRNAIKNYEGSDVVFVRCEEGFCAKEVTLGKTDGRFVEVTGEIHPGDEYATENVFVLKSELAK